jgi:hypothetical protein
MFFSLLNFVLGFGLESHVFGLYSSFWPKTIKIRTKIVN